jgi:stringent starvation protein B
MKSSRPYLLRAFYEWIVDNDFTPYIVINAELPGVDVPQKYIEDGRIVLNVSPAAVRSLLLANDHIEFNARFSGVPYDLYAPMRAVTAIYAKENGRGMVFKEDDDEEDGDVTTTTTTTQKGGGVLTGLDKPAEKENKGIKRANRPNLTIVK